MKNKHVIVPPPKALVHECPGFQKKLLADFHLELLALCGFGCAYCSSNAGWNLRLHRQEYRQLTVEQVGEDLLPTTAPELSLVWPDVLGQLERELAHHRRDFGRDRTLVFSMLTDGFSPSLVKEGITRAALDLLLEKTSFRIRVLTKNSIVGSSSWAGFFQERPGRFVVGLSTGMLDDSLAMKLEVGTSLPSARLRALRNLQDAGVPTFGMLCPSFPDILDGEELEKMIELVRPGAVEHVWAEPFNDRANWKAVRDAYSEDAPTREFLEAVYDGRDTPRWSSYATALYRRLRGVAEQRGWLEKLRFLLYEKMVTESDAKFFADGRGLLLQGKPDENGLSTNQAFVQLGFPPVAVGSSAQASDPNVTVPPFPARAIDCTVTPPAESLGVMPISPETSVAIQKDASGVVEELASNSMPAESSPRSHPNDDWMRQAGGNAKAGTNSPWPLPRPISTTSPAPAFLPDLLPAGVRPWVVDNAERLGVPLEYLAIPLVVTLGSLIGTALSIRPKERDDFSVHPLLWSAVIGPPGSSRSPAMRKVLELVHALDGRDADVSGLRPGEKKAREFEQGIRRHDIKRRMKEAIEQGHDLAPFEAELAALEAPRAAVRRRIVNDASPTALIEVLRDQPRGVLWHRDELAGLFESMRRPGREGERQLLLETWGGAGSFTIDRVSREPIVARSLALSVLGTIQPDRFLPLIQKAEKGGDADGFLQRFQLAVFPEPVFGQGVDRSPDGAAQEQLRRLVEKVDQLVVGEVGAVTAPSGAPFVRFSQEAQPIYSEWSAALEKSLRGAGSPGLRSHLSKSRSLMPALALVFHVIDVLSGDADPGPVAVRAAWRAADWSELLEKHVRRLYDLALASPKVPQLLLEKISSEQLESPFTVREVVRHHWKDLGDEADIRLGLRQLEQAHVVRRRVVPTAGRSREEFLVSPHVGTGTE